jgi:hypothetical protein
MNKVAAEDESFVAEDLVREGVEEAEFDTRVRSAEEGESNRGNWKLRLVPTQLIKNESQSKVTQNPDKDPGEWTTGNEPDGSASVYLKRYARKRKCSLMGASLKRRPPKGSTNFSSRDVAPNQKRQAPTKLRLRRNRGMKGNWVWFRRCGRHFRCAYQLCRKSLSSKGSAIGHLGLQLAAALQ